MRAYPSTRNNVGCDGRVLSGAAASFNRTRRCGITRDRELKKTPACIERRRAVRFNAAARNRADSEWSDARYVRGMKTLVSGLDFELNHLSLGEGLEAIHLDR